jgi:membrane associated rhomboid family serine protease
VTRFFQQDPFDFRSLPSSVKIIAGANILIYALLVLGSTFHALDLGLVQHFALLPERVLRWPRPELWRLFTHPFLHLSFFELLLSLVALWFFGAPVVGQWGDREFLNFYFICALGAAVPMLALNLPVVGSTACSYGMILAFAMLYPDATVYFFLLPMKPWHMIVLFALMDILVGTKVDLTRLVYLAGGLAAGYAYIRWWGAFKIEAKSFSRGLFEREQAPVQRRRVAPRREEPARVPKIDSGMYEVDRILDKILASGLDSLTEDERELMRRYSQRNKPS